MKITALFYYAPKMEHRFQYTKLEDNDDVCGGNF